MRDFAEWKEWAEARAQVWAGLKRDFDEWMVNEAKRRLCGQRGRPILGEHREPAKPFVRCDQKVRFVLHGHQIEAQVVEN